MADGLVVEGFCALDEAEDLTEMGSALPDGGVGSIEGILSCFGLSALVSSCLGLFSSCFGMFAVYNHSTCATYINCIQKATEHHYAFSIHLWLSLNIAYCNGALNSSDEFKSDDGNMIR